MYHKPILDGEYLRVDSLQQARAQVSDSPRLTWPRVCGLSLTCFDICRTLRCHLVSRFQTLPSCHPTATNFQHPDQAI